MTVCKPVYRWLQLLRIGNIYIVRQKLLFHEKVLKPMNNVGCKPLYLKADYSKINIIFVTAYVTSGKFFLTSANFDRSG